MMSTLTIAIQCENGAFFPTPAAEVARILRSKADAIEARGLESVADYAITDVNGNRVGSVSYCPPDTEN